MERNTIACMDALEFARSLPSNSVHCVITSPPYWNLRDYQVDGQIGLEDTPAAYIARQHGRHYIGSELSPEYVKIARERLRLPFEAHHVAVNNDVSDLPLFRGLDDGL